MKKINIMFLINSFSIAGAEKLVYDISKNLNKNRFNIFVCSISYSKDNKETEIRNELEEYGIKTFSLNKKSGSERLKAIIRLRGILTNYSIEILHTHCSSPDIYGKIASINKVPVVFSTIHSTGGYSPLRERFLNIITTKYIAISQTVSKYGSEHLKLPNNKVELIYNGVDINGFKANKSYRASILEEFKIDSNSLIITNVGRIVKEKGQEFLIDAIPKVLKKNPNVQFLIVGDCNLNENFSKTLKDKVKENDLERYVTFTGVRNDVKEILSASDLFVFPSIQEGFALVTLEALAAGIPIVATDVGSIREVLINKVNGLIIPPKSGDEIAEAINFMLNDLQNAKNMAQKGRDLVEKKFTINNTVKLHEELYCKFSKSKVF